MHRSLSAQKKMHRRRGSARVLVGVSGNPPFDNCCPRTKAPTVAFSSPFVFPFRSCRPPTTSTCATRRLSSLVYGRRPGRWEDDGAKGRERKQSVWRDLLLYASVVLRVLRARRSPLMTPNPAPGSAARPAVVSKGRAQRTDRFRKPNRLKTALEETEFKV
ncbi:unnamed protein product [Bursaphelenchus xylophilus]|uniref:(pine wood nematode) hypothetical protein n=1 Tax=Bursaphelenchus xylophilus TaxID=6326 RepID=A0A1I7SQP9_BURXY|nr:unnamed protein product [Bursaphelenchus xylophilus]CAG9110213.1 unnamed protein product [Bursaphelenchus xylophilus]